MSIHINLIEQFSERVIKQLFLTSSRGEMNGSFQYNSEKIIENLRKILMYLKNELAEYVKLEDDLRDLNSELFKLKINFDDVNEKHKNSITKIEELEKKIKESNGLLGNLEVKLNKAKDEMENLSSQLKNSESKLKAKQSEKSVLEQKRKINEEKKNELISQLSIKRDKSKEEYNQKLDLFKIERSNKVEALNDSWTNKISHLNQQLDQFKKDNFFLMFLTENEEEKIPELEILVNLLKKEQWNLDDLKNGIDLPPILAIRIIKQMAIKNIVNFDEENNTVSISKEVFHK
jgi:chromosome segregation ATPase